MYTNVGQQSVSVSVQKVTADSEASRPFFTLVPFDQCCQFRRCSSFKRDLTLLAAIRRLSPSSGVILMTAHGTPEVTRGALDLGAYEVMHKPFELHDLEPLLLKAFASSGPDQSTPR